MFTVQTKQHRPRGWPKILNQATASPSQCHCKRLRFSSCSGPNRPWPRKSNFGPKSRKPQKEYSCATSLQPAQNKRITSPNNESCQTTAHVPLYFAISSVQGVVCATAAIRAKNQKNCSEQQIPRKINCIPWATDKAAEGWRRQESARSLNNDRQNTKVRGSSRLQPTLGRAKCRRTRLVASYAGVMSHYHKPKPSGWLP